MDFIKNINHKNSFLDKKKSICLVGSSPDIIGSNKGKEIDKFDTIIRFNDVKIEGFENDIGKKTDILVMNSAAFDSSKQPYNKIFGKNNTNYDIKQKLNNIKILTYPIRNIIKNKLKLNEKKELYNIHESNDIYSFIGPFSMGLKNIDLLEGIKNGKFKIPYPKNDKIRKETRYNNIRKLSLGISFIITLIHNGFKPNIIGFTLKNDIIKMDDYYRGRKGISLNHDFVFEIDYLNQLIEEDYIKLI